MYLLTVRYSNTIPLTIHFFSSVFRTVAFISFIFKIGALKTGPFLRICIRRNSFITKVCFASTCLCIRYFLKKSLYLVKVSRFHLTYQRETYSSTLTFKVNIFLTSKFHIRYFISRYATSVCNFFTIKF